MFLKMITVKIDFKFTPARILYWAIVILLILTCLPIAQILPETLRKLLQGFSMLMFTLGIILQGEKRLLLGFALCVLFYFTYVFNVFGADQGFVRCLFNVFADFAFVFYGLCLIADEEQNSDLYAKRLVQLFFVLFVLTAITTIIGVQKYPLAVRELGRSGSGYGYGVYGDVFVALKRKYLSLNIASWSIAYGMVFVGPQFITLYRKTKQKRYIFALVVCEVCVVASQLTIGTILSLMALFLLLYTPSKRKKDVIVVLLLVIIALFLAIFSREIVLLMISIASKFGFSMAQNKLADLATLLSGTSAGDASDRFGLYGKGVKLFIQHPVLGQSIFGVTNSQMFGLHSDFFDLLGYYGLFGAFVIITLCISYFRFIKTRLTDGIWNIFAMLVCFLVLLALNPVWYSPQVFAGALLLPMAVRCHNEFSRSQDDTLVI